MFFIKKDDHRFSELELLSNPKIIKKIKKMDDDELLEFVEESLSKNEMIKLKEIVNNLKSDKVKLVHEYLKGASILTKKTEFYLFSSKMNAEIYNQSNMCSKEINKNTDWS